jgi:hypothetical protein
MNLPNTEKGLKDLIEAAQTKLKAVRLENQKQKAEYAARIVKKAKPDMYLLVARPLPEFIYTSVGRARATRQRHKLTPGTVMRVRWVQPRAARVWGILGGVNYCFDGIAERDCLGIYATELEAQVAWATKRGATFDR